MKDGNCDEGLVCRPFSDQEAGPDLRCQPKAAAGELCGYTSDCEEGLECQGAQGWGLGITLGLVEVGVMTAGTCR